MLLRNSRRGRVLVGCSKKKIEKTTTMKGASKNAYYFQVGFTKQQIQVVKQKLVKRSCATNPLPQQIRKVTEEHIRKCKIAVAWTQTFLQANQKEGPISRSS